MVDLGWWMSESWWKSGRRNKAALLLLLTSSPFQYKFYISRITGDLLDLDFDSDWVKVKVVWLCSDFADKVGLSPLLLLSRLRKWLSTGMDRGKICMGWNMSPFWRPNGTTHHFWMTPPSRTQQPETHGHSRERVGWQVERRKLCRRRRMQER